MVTSCFEEIRIGNGLQLQCKEKLPYQKGCMKGSQWPQSTAVMFLCRDPNEETKRGSRQWTPMRRPKGELSLHKMEEITEGFHQREGRKGKLPPERQFLLPNTNTKVCATKQLQMAEGWRNRRNASQGSRWEMRIMIINTKNTFVLMMSSVTIFLEPSPMHFLF